MSKATFEEERVVKNGNREDWDYFKELLDKHGGRVVWPLETPPGEGCRCSQDYIDKTQGVMNFDIDKPGPWHGHGCPMHVPF